jgi:hypothetical protein
MLHLLAITIGLLLALGLEASVEWLHHQSLVRESEERISLEIRDNRKRLAAESAALPVEEAQLQALLKWVNDLQDSRPAKIPQGMRWAATRLGASAWNTSAVSGATAHMTYEEIQRYAQIYSMQDTYNSNMDRYLNSRFEMFAFLERLNLPDKPSSAEFEAAKRVIANQIVTGRGLLEIIQALTFDVGVLSPVR